MNTRTFHGLLSSFSTSEYIDDRLEALESLDIMAETHALEMGLPLIDCMFQNIDVRLEMRLLAKILRAEKAFIEIFLKKRDRFHFLMQTLETDVVTCDGVDCLELILSTCPECPSPLLCVSSDCASSVASSEETFVVVSGGKRFCHSRIALTKSYENISSVIINLVRHRFTEIPEVLLVNDESLCSVVVFQGIFDLLPFDTSLLKIVLKDNVLAQRIFLELPNDSELLFELRDVLLDTKNPDASSVGRRLRNFIHQAMQQNDFVFLHRMASVDSQIAKCCVLRKLLDGVCERNLSEDSSFESQCPAEIHDEVCKKGISSTRWNIDRDFRWGLLLLLDQHIFTRCISSFHPLVAMLNYIHHLHFVQVDFSSSPAYLLYAVVCYDRMEPQNFFQVLFDLSSSPLRKGLCLLLLVLRGERVNLRKETMIFYLRRVRVWMEEEWVPVSLRELVCTRVCEAIQECLSLLNERRDTEGTLEKGDGITKSSDINTGDVQNL